MAVRPSSSLTVTEATATSGQPRPHRPGQAVDPLGRPSSGSGFPWARGRQWSPKQSVTVGGAVWPASTAYASPPRSPASAKGAPRVRHLLRVPISSNKPDHKRCATQPRREDETWALAVA